ncbi:RDD family protein [Rhabdobacter roseus]|uniref:Putative RDD family membrane protein YckC n=1 Tax=Rhabdobacter roseus TaxID=1655419 RepID=A0A840U110_9BACT|nr:RDD family protein [Rhabdobacter roseus]MBB5287582.1 putative RDD family membrane protein YckC [Rhabdobacter roseus]
MNLRIQTAQNVAIDYEPASLGERIIAQILDYIVYVLWLLAVLALMGLLANRVNPDSISGTWITIGGIILPIMLYSLLCEYFLDGQTMGKKIMRIKVVRLDGRQATLSAYLLRWLLSLVDVVLFTGLVAVLTIIINGRGQRLGDLAAGTTVVKAYRSIRLHDIAYPPTPTDYQPTYPQTTQLTDRDIRTIREVVGRKDPEMTALTAEKVAAVLGVQAQSSAYDFLVTLLNDYAFYASNNLD